MTKIAVIGLDPSLSNFGFAKATVDLDTMTFEINDLGLIETAPADKATKKVVRQNSSDLERAKALHAGLQSACVGAWMAFAEVPVGSQSARAMASYGISVGILASCPIPIVQVTPTEVKLAGAGVKTATKEEMIEWAAAKYPHAPWRRQTRSSPGRAGKHGGRVGAYKAGDLMSENEHLADAVAAIEAGLKTDDFLKIVSMMRGTPAFATVS